MAANDWNFLAGRLTGDGQIAITETDLPIEIDSIDYNLSAPKTMSGNITNRVARLRKSGQPVFEPWNTVVLATLNDNLRAMGIYRDPTFNDSVWELDIAGMGSYPAGMLYDGSVSKIGVDPLDMWRLAWDHLLTAPGGNIRVSIDRDVTSPIRIGTKEEPYKLNFWDTLDLGQAITSLAQETPFDWVERDRFGADGQPECHLDAGYPEIGTIVQKGGLILGENLATVPQVGGGGGITGVHIYGAGEGSKRIRGYAGISGSTKVRRVKVLEDETIRTSREANARAQLELAATKATLTVEQVEIHDHPNLPLRSVALGNQYRLYAETEHVTVDQFVRVVGMSENPLEGGRATLTVVRSDAA